jgi:hypothetical protein
LIVPACVADVTVTVSGSLAASGLAVINVPDQPPLSDSFNIGGSNTQPVFNFSQSGTASVESGSLFATASAFIQQNVDVGPGQLSTYFEIDGSAFTPGPAFAGGNVTAINQNTMVIQVSNPVLFNLSGTANLAPGKSLANILVELEGPGVSFVEDPVGFFQGSFLFVQGEYILTESGFMDGSANPLGGGFSGSLSLQMNGDFTPVVPEPGSMPIVAATALLMGAIFCCRRRCDDATELRQPHADRPAVSPGSVRSDRAHADWFVRESLPLVRRSPKALQRVADCGAGDLPGLGHAVRPDLSFESAGSCDPG